MFDKQPTYDLKASPEATKGTYYPLVYSEELPTEKRIREVAAAICSFYLKRQMSISKLQKMGEISLPWTDKKKRSHSGSLSFQHIADHLRQRQTFLNTDFDLPPLLCNWLDSSVVIKMKSHAPSNPPHNIGLAYEVPPSLGNTFPLSPTIDREGLGFSSCQLFLQGIVLQSRDRVITGSNKMLHQHTQEWYADLLLYLNSAIALIENTLHQLFYKAKYDNIVVGWNPPGADMFPYAERFRDKFKWIGKITGKPLDNVTTEMEKIITLKKIRNHLNHFDPPILAFTIEDVCTWVNYIDDLALLLWRIRDKLGSPLSVPLVNMLLAKRATWKPFDPGKKRFPQMENVGYASCCWKRE